MTIQLNKIYLRLAGLALLFAGISCAPKSEMPAIDREDVTSLIIQDCIRQQYSITTDELIDELLHALDTSHPLNVRQLRNHAGYAKIWMVRSKGRQAVYLEITASNVHGIVIEYGGMRASCAECRLFFDHVKKYYPDINWCKVPPI
jgi:hypothetical protein